jgi:hypothetical protein
MPFQALLWQIIYQRIWAGICGTHFFTLCGVTWGYETGTLCNTHMHNDHLAEEDSTSMTLPTASPVRKRNRHGQVGGV